MRKRVQITATIVFDETECEDIDSYLDEAMDVLHDIVLGSDYVDKAKGDIIVTLID